MSAKPKRSAAFWFACTCGWTSVLGLGYLAQRCAMEPTRAQIDHPAEPSHVWKPGQPWTPESTHPDPKGEVR